jgi:hypothetical protein
MPITAQHSLTMTTPDNTAFENRPSHWNESHLVTANIVGSEVSGAFSNAGNVTFGLETNGFITASANAAGAGDGFNRISAGTQIAGTNNTISFADGSGVTFGMSNSSVITAAVATTYAGSNHSHGNPTLNLTNLSGTTASNSAGFTLSLSAGNYLTTARASNDALGLNTAGTNVTWTANSSGLSINAAGYAGTATAITGRASITLNSGGMSFNGSALAGTGTAVTGNASITLNSSGLSFNGSGLAGTGTSATNASITMNSAGLAISVAAPGAATLTVSAVGNTTVNSSGTWANAVPIRGYGVLSVGTSNGSLLLSTPDPVDFTYLSVGNSNLGNTAGDTGVFSQRMVLVGSNNITLSGSSNGGSVTLSIIGGAGGGFSAGVSNVGNTAGNTGLTGSNIVFSGGNGVSLSQSTHANGATIGFSVNTSYAASNHSHGNPTLALTNINGTTASASNGLTLSLSVAAAIESNAFNLLGANTAGNTTATGSTIGLSGINLTLSGTNNSVINISAPATSSLVGTNGLSVSTNGSTIYAYPTPLAQWDNFWGITAAGTAAGNSLVSVQPLRIEWPVAFSNVAIPVSIAITTAANNSTAYIDVSMSGVVYTRNASTLSSLFSFSNSFTQTWTSNASQTVTGVPFLTATHAGTTLTPGQYYMALHISTNNTATGGANTTALANTVSVIQAQVIGSAANNVKAWGAQTNASIGMFSGGGIISTGATRATIGLSDIVNTGTRGVLAQYAVGFRNATYQ